MCYSASQILLLPQLPFPSYTTDEVWLVLSFKLKKKCSYVSCFPGYNKIVFVFYKKISMHIVHLIDKKVF